VRALCDRRRGAGADGVLLLKRPGHDFTMRYWNSMAGPPSSAATARCLARYALDLGLGREGRVRFATDAG
jgi:diaminopimelate epimerase